ncbi:hypothetical protein [Niveibacterium sp. SC-1]|uniref:hypothetical protein n=1 Tax=Niveibacterium sp. SC-1 TaxID=3135646 RepID=UPI00311F9217
MLKKTVLAAALAAAFASPAFAQEDVRAELRALHEEVQRLRAELDAMKKGGAQPAAVVATPVATPAATGASAVATTPAAPTTAVAPSAVAAAPEAAEPATKIFGYGELSYSRPRGDAGAAQATVGRFVIGLSHDFNDKTRFASEVEIENAVASADDQGEVEVEQVYIEHQFSPEIAGKAGLFLMPIGLLNESHEPPNYYGVHRNFVETAIIPTTWREIGLGATGRTSFGLRWDTGITTGFDLTKWDSTSEESIESPMGSIHQEGQLAKAGNPSFYGALNYNGVPGLNLGGSLFYGKVAQKQADFPSPDASLTLAEVHARWTPGDWDLSALYAIGNFDNVEAFNLTQVGNPYPVPKRFDGWYLQGAYKVWTSGEYALLPFARYEQVNTARSYDAALSEFGYSGRPTDKIVTTGATFQLHPQVVLKADYQWFHDNSSRDALNVGVGFTY